jgi:hypothetical protein
MKNQSPQDLIKTQIELRDNKIRVLTDEKDALEIMNQDIIKRNKNTVLILSILFFISIIGNILLLFK